jgi:hypothetical protein
MAAAGTISGGAIAITPTTPQSARSIAIGFALRGMLDPQTTTTLAVPIAAGADDARENPSTTVVNVSSTTLFVQNASMTGLRFTGLSAIAGKVIVQAQIQLTAVNSEGLLNNGAWTIRAEAADSAAPYAASNGNISGRPLTTASRTWILPAWTAGDRTLRQRSPDMRSVVQEVSDRVGFGGVVNVVITNVGTAPARTFAAFEHATLQEATLTVRYLP